MPAPVLIVSIVAIVVVLYGFYESLKPHFCFLVDMIGIGCTRITMGL